MESEVLFVKYAFPCSFILLQRGEITPEESKKLENAAVHHQVLDHLFLEKIFFRAFRRIETLAKEMKKDKWDFDVIHAYFVTRHNELIQNGMETYENAPESLRNLCMVHRARVKEIKDNFLIVEYGKNQTRPVSKEMVPHVQAGDEVTIHYGYAIEPIIPR